MFIPYPRFSAPLTPSPASIRSNVGVSSYVGLAKEAWSRLPQHQRYGAAGFAAGASAAFMSGGTIERTAEKVGIPIVLIIAGAVVAWAVIDKKM